MEDLKIMLRVLLLGLFVWLTMAFPMLFMGLWWVFVFIVIIASVREAKIAQNKRISDGIDELRRNMSKNVDSEGSELEISDEAKERAAHTMMLKDAHYKRRDFEYVEGDAD